MNTSLDLSLVRDYKSPSQIARVLTETWVQEQMFCPKCGNLHISHFGNNRPVADFYCSKCGQEFELKSKKGAFGRVVVDGAYDTMIERITSRSNPNFMFMNYTITPKKAAVTDLIFVPKHFFTPLIIEKRQPLSQNARRVGWVGCNILLYQIPEQGRIPIISDNKVTVIEQVVHLVHRAESLEKDSFDAKGWLFDVLNCVNAMPKLEFSLADIYQYEPQLQYLHPNNHNVKAKIRQQLQFLRNAHFLEFLGNGRYRKVSL